MKNDTIKKVAAALVVSTGLTALYAPAAEAGNGISIVNANKKYCHFVPNGTSKGVPSYAFVSNNGNTGCCGVGRFNEIVDTRNFPAPVRAPFGGELRVRIVSSFANCPGGGGGGALSGKTPTGGSATSIQGTGGCGGGCPSGGSGGGTPTGPSGPR